MVDRPKKFCAVKIVVKIFLIFLTFVQGVVVTNRIATNLPGKVGIVREFKKVWKSQGKVWEFLLIWGIFVLITQNSDFCCVNVS